MFFGHIERELLREDIYPHNQKLPENLQLQIDKEQGKPDIWECQCEEIQATVKQQSLSKPK